jgi:hypothetical protein
LSLQLFRGGRFLAWMRRQQAILLAFWVKSSSHFKSGKFSCVKLQSAHCCPPAAHSLQK